MQLGILKKQLTIFFFVALLSLFASQASFAQVSKSYDLYMRLGQKAYQAREYQKALTFFKQAHFINPSSLESVQYIDQIKQYIKDAEEKSAVNPSLPPIVSEDKNEGDHDFSEEEVNDQNEMRESIVEDKDYSAQEYQEKKSIVFAEKPGKPEGTIEQTLNLDDELWQEQPNMRLTIEMNKTVILEGKNIEKFLVITEGFLKAERIDRDHVRISAVQRGTTFFHIWEEHGRWTFNIETVFPIELTKGYQEVYEEMTEVSTRPFHFYYANNWSSLYDGEDVSKLRKRNLIFREWMTVSGETPYGDASSSVYFYKYGNDIVPTSYSAGLSKGHWGNFKDFSVRAVDTSKRFSDLSLPGRDFRGILFDAYAFTRKIKYTLLEGRDQSSFANLSPGVTKKQKTFLEGAQLTLFPDEPNNYTINYARGYGSNRSSELKDRVYSLVTNHRHDKIKLDTEIATDEDKWAGRVRSVYNNENRSFTWAVRDIEKGFATITGRPSGRGEIGSNFNYEWRDKIKNFSAYLDLYQDREQENPEHSNLINYDLSTAYGFRFNPKLRYASSFYYSATPQIISQRNNLRLNQSITKTFDFFNLENISATLGNAFQSSRYKRTPTSEFDRFELNAGLQFPLVKYVYAFLNYEYSWVDELSANEWSHPSVATYGLSYSKSLTEKLTGNANVTYRNEEDTQGSVSFLSGEDSLSTNIGVDYRVAPNTTVYIDGRVRNVWSEIANRDDFNEAEIQLGLQSDWDLPFYWNPLGAVKGYIYYDANRNSQMDKEERGIKGVVVKAGKKKATTNADGKYFIRVNAKKVKVSIDPQTLPQGAFFSTESEYEADIDQQRIHRVNFGLTTQTGIYGVVYFDQNQNNQLDSDDTYLSNIEIQLNDTDKAKTDSKGGYNFYDVKPGKHTITLNVNSLPLEYIPLIKIKNKINVKEGITAIFNIPLKKK